MPDIDTEKEDSFAGNSGGDLMAGPGSIIRSARESQGLTADELAAEIKITRQKLLKIEHDQFESVGTDTFVRGYLRNAARVLNLDATKLVDQYNGYMASNDRPVVEAPVSVPTTASGKPKWLLPLIISITLFLLWSAASFLFSADPEGAPELSLLAKTITANEKSLPTKTLPESPTVNQTDESRLETQTISLNGSRPSPEKPLNNTDNSAILQQTSAPTQDLIADANEIVDVEVAAAVNRAIESPSPRVSAVDNKLSKLVFNFKDICWLEVKDNTGRRLFSNSKAAGESLVLEGESPFSVRLGNVHAVDIKYNGLDVELTPNEFRKTLKLNIPSNQ